MGNENVFLKLLISVSISALSLRFIPKKYLAFLCGAFVYALFNFLIERNHPSKITFQYCVVYFSSMTGQFLIDEEFLKQEGVTDFEEYALNPGGNLYTDLFVEND